MSTSGTTTSAFVKETLEGSFARLKIIAISVRKKALTLAGLGVTTAACAS